MGENIQLHWGVSRVAGDTLDLLEDEERRCLDISILQASVVRQMVFPWAKMPSRLVQDMGDYQTVVEMPVAYLEALEELEILLSGAYDGPVGGCPVGEVYVDRGDVSSYDFLITDLAVDGYWHSLDLGSIITDADATGVEIVALFMGPSTPANMQFRETNNTYIYNRLIGLVPAAGLYGAACGAVTLGPDRSLDYYATASLTNIYITVRGWWKPAA